MMVKFTTNKVSKKSLLLSAVLGCSLSAAAIAQEGPPGTDIFVADLSMNLLGFWATKNFEAVTTRKGYDNQPYFLPDGSGLLYTAMLQTDNGQWQADSFEYNFDSKKHTNLTNSPLSEYSPTLMAGGYYFSSIVVEANNKQHLWGLPFHSKAKAYRMSNLEPVGYHVWGKKGAIAMFVLGSEKLPNDKSTLQFQKNFKTKPKIVANDIGRSLRFTPQRNAYSFSQLKSDKKWWLSEYHPKTDSVTALVPMPKGSDYYTWIDDKTAVTAVGNELRLWKYSADSKSASTADWMPWMDASKVCKTKVTRLAVDRDKSRLAIVCDE
jgi:hypothetical protein